MASLLLVTADPKSAAAVQPLASLLGLRTRLVNSATSALEWLSMENFQAMLVDARYGEEKPTELITTGWKHNPYMLGGIFNLYGPVENEWYPRLLGVRIFWGEKALGAIQKALATIPQDPTKIEDYGVLIVEDLDSPRFIISAYTEALGFPHVESAAGAEEALKLLSTSTKRFFCVITDLNMPQVSGLELIERIRRDEDLAYLPVIVLTAYATDENLIECVRAGATGFLVKPPRKNQLRAELEKAKRIVFSRQSPRLCRPEDAQMLEDAILRTTVR